MKNATIEKSYGLLLITDREWNVYQSRRKTGKVLFGWH